MFQYSQTDESGRECHCGGSASARYAGGLALTDTTPFLRSALDACWENVERLRRTLRQADNPAQRAAATVLRETGVSVDANPYVATSLTRNVLEAVIHAAYHTRAAPEVLMAKWAKEGSLAMTTTPQTVSQASTAANARTLARSGIYYRQLGVDLLTVTVRPGGVGDNLLDETDAGATAQEAHFGSQVRRLVTDGVLREDISAAVNAGLTVTGSAGTFRVQPSVAFYGLSLLLVDAVFARFVAMSFPEMSHVSERLGYMLWNMGAATFATFLASADRHRRERAHLVGGAPISIEQWALHTTPSTTEWAQARRNAIRFGYYVDCYRPIFQDVMNLITPGIEDLRNVHSRVANVAQPHVAPAPWGAALALLGGGAARFTHAALETDGRARGDNVALRWNFDAPPTTPVRVVIYLHGYADNSQRTGLRRRSLTPTAFIDQKASESGLTFNDTDGTSHGNAPVLAIMPRGVEGSDHRRFTWEALSSRGGTTAAAALMSLIRAALSHVGASALGGSVPQLGECWLFAHSGGGAGVNALLSGGADPHVVVCFDATYNSSNPIKTWLRARGTPTGLRVLVTQGSMAHWCDDAGSPRLKRATECSAREVLGAIAAPSTAVRVEHTTVSHGSCVTYFSRALALDVSAELDPIARAHRGRVVPLASVATQCGRAPGTSATLRACNPATSAHELGGWAESASGTHPSQIVGEMVSSLLFDDGSVSGGMVSDTRLDLAADLSAGARTFLEARGLFSAGPPARMRLQGRFVAPRDLARRREAVPIVFIVMGNHPAFDGTTEIESFKGYDYMQQILADRGIASCSIDTNFANALDLGIRSRAEIVVKMVERLPTLVGSATSAKLDFTRTGLVGHSRGGEAVVLAALLLPSRLPSVTVTAVCSIAPTDFSSIPSGVTTDGVALPYVLGHGAMRYLVLYGSHDGDVAGIGNNGFGLYDRATIAKTLVYARGMTHNRFNTVWNECADYADARHAFVSPSDCRTRAGTFDNRIFAAVVHRNYANFFVDALLRRQLLGDASAEGALRGINIPSGAALGQPAGLQGPAGSIQWAVAGARAVDEFDTTVTRTITGGAIENANTARPRVPHRTKAYVAAATGNKVRIDLPVGQRDQSGKLELTFRLTSSIDVTSEATIRAAPEPDWEMRLISASGTHAARPVALDRRGLRAPNRPFFHVTNHPANVTKQQMDTLVLPLSAFRGATLNDVRAVEFEARGGSFPLILDSVAFV